MRRKLLGFVVGFDGHTNAVQNDASTSAIPVRRSSLMPSRLPVTINLSPACTLIVSSRSAVVSLVPSARSRTAVGVSR